MVAHTVAIHCRLLKYTRQLFTKNFQHKNHQQLDSTIADAPLLARGLDKSFYGYAKWFSNEWSVECEELHVRCYAWNVQEIQKMLCRNASHSVMAIAHHSA